MTEPFTCQTIRWASDLHLDHADDAARARFLGSLAGADVPLLLTGDTSVAPRLVADLTAILAATAGPVWAVLGNHDHYGSSIAAVRDSVIALADREPRFRWLPPAGVISLAPDWALVGVDGWADGRQGSPLTTPVRLNDDRLIAELAAQPGRRGRLAVKQALADADAARLATLLDRAAAVASHLLVATHVPPFVAALPATGRLASPDWLPLLVCEATGQALRQAAERYPEHDFLVLTGHSHAAQATQVAANLRCIVAGARYGEPEWRSVPRQR
ncbi:MAG TPA: metallophosphoesterase [Gemmatimonadales bacterium]|jgi:predicted phosphodiesterase